MKILHLPTSVGGNSYGLSRAERSLGAESDCLYSEETWLKYPADICLRLEGKSNFKKLIKLILTFIRIRRKYDIFHFNFGSSLINFNKPFLKMFDLPFYPKNKKLFMTYNGCDARQKYVTMRERAVSACGESRCYGGMCNSGKLDLVRQASITLAAKRVDHIFYLNPDLGKFLPKEKSSFLPYTIASWNKIEAIRNYPSPSPGLRIVHAPTNRVTKGSKFLINAVDEINRENGDIVDLVLVEKMSHDEALKVYRTADLVVDQLLIGWYGALSVEVMKMGVPIAFFLNEDDADYLPDGILDDIKEATINMNPFDVKNTLLKIINDKSVLEKKGKAGLDYVNKWHAPKEVANMVIEKYKSV